MRNLLANALDGFTHESTIKFEITEKKTYNTSLIQQPNWLELILYDRIRGAQQGKYVGNIFVF